jgi:hypothetical protein
LNFNIATYKLGNRPATTSPGFSLSLQKLAQFQPVKEQTKSKFSKGDTTSKSQNKAVQIYKTATPSCTLNKEKLKSKSDNFLMRIPSMDRMNKPPTASFGKIDHNSKKRDKISYGFTPENKSTSIQGLDITKKGKKSKKADFSQLVEKHQVFSKSKTSQFNGIPSRKILNLSGAENSEKFAYKRTTTSAFHNLRQIEDSDATKKSKKTPLVGTQEDKFEAGQIELEME